MKIRKIMTAISAAAMAGVMLAGCSSSNGGSSTAGGSSADNGGAASGSGETVSLTVWGSQEDQEILKQMCDEFAAANPDKKYEFTYAWSARPTHRRKCSRTYPQRPTYSHSLLTRPLRWLTLAHCTE